MAGKGAGKGERIKAGGVACTCKLLTDGRAPAVTADGDKLVIGGQTISMQDGHLVLGKMAGPWEGAP
jgi:hypothetical protein